MKDKIVPEDCHPEIAKILGEFCEEMLSKSDKPEFLKPDLPPLGDIDQRLIDYSPEYVENKPGVVKES